MIHVKIVSKIDFDSNSIFEFELDHLSIGMTKCSHLTVYEPLLDGKKIILNIRNEKLYINSNELGFKVNKCDFFGTKKVSKNDVIQIGELEIQILNFKRSFMTAKELSEELISHKENLQGSNKEELNLIELIEDEIINYEVR